MPLELQLVQEDDFRAMANYVSKTTGDFVAPALKDETIEMTDEDARVCVDWSLAQQLDIFKNDKTATWLKVVDTDQQDAILSLGRWHFYDSRYEYSTQELAGDKDPEDPASYPSFMNVDYYRAVLDALMLARNEWMAEGPKWS